MLSLPAKEPTGGEVAIFKKTGNLSKYGVQFQERQKRSVRVFNEIVDTLEKNGGPLSFDLLQRIIRKLRDCPTAACQEGFGADCPMVSSLDAPIDGFAKDCLPTLIYHGSVGLAADVDFA